MNALAQLSRDPSPSILDLVARASDVVPPVWPLKRFIARNPLEGLERLPFEDAVAVAAQYWEVGNDPCWTAVNREVIKWCSACFDLGQAAIAMPGRGRGFYAAFADLAPLDGRLKGLPPLPATPEDAISRCLDRLGVPDGEEFIRQSLAALPGWAGYLKGQGALLDYVAVRLAITCALWPEARLLPLPQPRRPDFVDAMEAAEARYRSALVDRLVTQARPMRAAWRNAPDAQLVFCIDTRSEPLRRALEQSGNYETLGCAGFFGLPISVRGAEDDEAHPACPVLIEPRHEVVEPSSRSPWLKGFRAVYQALKYNFTTPFALVELLGAWCGLLMLVQTQGPESVTRDPAGPAPDHGAIPLSEQVAMAEGALRSMGLIDHFAPLVVLCGHAASTRNNAYAAALDCGACAGNPGGPNARVLAAILNTPAVRDALAGRGLGVPAHTWFVAAEHETTTGTVTLFDPGAVPERHREALDRLQRDLRQVRTRVVDADAVRRSRDWAEVRQEWGQAGNAAFIVGPRRLTRPLDLEGRCFLHTYDWRSDPDGTVLEGILTGPLVVGHWISSQYLFSALDNVRYGGGSKVTQNVVGKLGIMQGNASDLMHGLPLQSVHETDDVRRHEPLRLLAVVYAPRAQVEALVERHQTLHRLFRNGWMTLVVIDPAEDDAWRLERDGGWFRLGPGGGMIA